MDRSRLIEITGMLHSVTHDRDVRERLFYFMDTDEDGFLDHIEVRPLPSAIAQPTPIGHRPARHL